MIPKPEADDEFTIKGWGDRNGEIALVYFIPNRSNPEKPHEKAITVSEWEQAQRQLDTTGEFTKTWFSQNMPRCTKEGSCNFTTIGGIFTLLGFAVYSQRGVYRKVHSKRNTARDPVT